MDVSVVILTRRRARGHFRAGGDIHQMVKSTPRGVGRRAVRFAVEPTWHLASFSKPIIGAINGLAYGRGGPSSPRCWISASVASHAEFPVPSPPNTAAGEFHLVVCRWSSVCLKLKSCSIPAG